MSKAQVLVLDFGSQYTQLVARRVRALGVSCEIRSPRLALTELAALAPRLVVLSGGPASVDAPGAPGVPDGFWEWQQEEGLWVLGVCYGMQLMVRDLGGTVRRAPVPEYGRALVNFETGEFGVLGQSPVWMSHGDDAERLPAKFVRVATSEHASIAAMADLASRRLGIQFHPEVTHTESGETMLAHVIFTHAKCQKDWILSDWIKRAEADITQQVGASEVICALSGGVDSTVAATLVSRAIGAKLKCVFVDHGLMRFKERERVMALFERLSLNVTAVDASSEFLPALKGVSDPEKKRKISGEKFIRTFEKFAKEQATHAKFLVQGTLYPDVIESSPGHRLSETIKTHHNVGGLPKDLNFSLIEPLRELFKDEVREIGRLLKIPEDFLMRHPFPGPGLAVRILGEITPDRIEMLQKADEIFVQGLREEGLYSQIWQAFAVLLPVESVGVQGDGRTVGRVLALRAVTSKDGMTAEAFGLPHEFVTRIAAKICNQVRGINRVVVDVTSKPPATIEWE